MDQKDAIERCLAGEVDAYRHLVELVQRRALFLSLRMLRDKDDAEEAVQASLVRAFEKLRQFDAARPFYPWFRTILKNECLKRLDRRNRHVPIDEASVPANRQPRDQRAEVREVLGLMDPGDMEILTLKHVEGLKYSEIAERLGIPAGTVMSRLHTARARFRRLVEEPHGS